MSVRIDSTLEDFIKDNIRNWVGKNFGSQEADDPSWDIKSLSRYLTRELNKREQTFTSLTKCELTILTKTMDDKERVKIMDKIRNKVERVGGIWGVYQVEDDKFSAPIDGETEGKRISVNLELPGDTRTIRIMNAWLDRQRLGHGIILRFILVQNGW